MPIKNAFVTGGPGFIGLNLVEQLTQSGWDVVALHRPNSKLTHLQKYPVRLVEGTIEDAASLERAMPEDVDAVFHVAGDVSLWSGHKQRFAARVFLESGFKISSVAKWHSPRRSQSAHSKSLSTQSVISGHCPASASCPLFPSKRTFISAVCTSA